MRHMLRLCGLATTLRSTNIISAFSLSFRYVPVAAMSSSASSLPAEPHRYLSRPDTLDLSDLETKINDADERRQSAYDLSRRIGVALAKCKAASEVGGDLQQAADAELNTLMADVFGATTSGNTPSSNGGARKANLSYKVEDYLRYKSYCHFLATGKLIPSSTFPGATDEEYLAGVCIGLAHLTLPPDRRCRRRRLFPRTAQLRLLDLRCHHGYILS